MTRVSLSFPEIGIIGGTRAAIGVGIGLLLADRLTKDQRRAAGWAFLIVGAITTAPIAAQLWHARRESAAEQSPKPTEMAGGRMASKEYIP